jgi:hypothetical protein
MVKFRNCVFVVAFFALISFLAFFPAGSKPQPAGQNSSTDSVSAPTPIPQKADSVTVHKTTEESRDRSL